MVNASDVFVKLMERPEINPDHPALANVRRYDVSLFEAPTCKKGGGYIVVTPQGSAGGNLVATCTREIQYFVKFDIIQDSQDKKGFAEFLRTASRIEGLFRPGLMVLFENESISTTLAGVEHTIAAPFNLFDIGISKSEIASTTTPKRIKSGSCSPWKTSILVRLTLHF